MDLFTLVRRELHSDCLALLQAPHIQEEAQLTLPLDINNYPFYRFVQIYFRVRCTYKNSNTVFSLKLPFQQHVHYRRVTTTRQMIFVLTERELIK